MSAPMPERVWLIPDPYAMSGDWWADGKTVREDGEVPYVPESRLLAAEARAKAMEDGPLDYMSGKCDRLKEQNAALRADLDALVPLARLGLAVLDGGRDLHKAVLASTAHDAAMALVFVDYPVVDGEQIVRFSLDQPTTTQARAILAREET